MKQKYDDFPAAREAYGDCLIKVAIVLERVVIGKVLASTMRMPCIFKLLSDYAAS